METPLRPIRLLLKGLDQSATTEGASEALGQSASASVLIQFCL